MKAPTTCFPHMIPSEAAHPQSRLEAISPVQGYPGLIVKGSREGAGLLHRARNGHAAAHAVSRYESIDYFPNG